MNSPADPVSPTDAAVKVKARLRVDLREAIKARKVLEVKVIRALVAAIDNAEARPIDSALPTSLQHDFLSGSAEVERLLLNEHDVRRVLFAEVEERERAAAEMEHLNMAERAKALRGEALLARYYLE